MGGGVAVAVTRISHKKGRESREDGGTHSREREHPLIRKKLFINLGRWGNSKTTFKKET